MEKSKTLFEHLNLTPKVKRAVDEIGFTTATDIQAKAIPLIRTGADVIGRSQTGTGKTVAFAIPAIEQVDTHADRPVVQVLILCPTRELAVQACDEIKKLVKYKHGVKPIAVYGGAAMDRQIAGLRKANIVIGTPGRIMDHLRRRTLKLQDIKMVVLDEADEMLSMGFKEDIETILETAPEDRQTVLFSATMPKSILNITKQFQNDPQIVEIDKQNVTLDNITQSFIDVPMGRKKDALNLLLKYFSPNLSIIFCNTKSMVDDISGFLNQSGYNAEGLHGDMKQSQRTSVMNSFKNGKTNILVATDVAARGIDVNDVDYVINYDIPQNNEYYVHRIGRTGRAMKNGTAITICSGRRQVMIMKNIAHAVKSNINQIPVPSAVDIKKQAFSANVQKVISSISSTQSEYHKNMLEEILNGGNSPYDVALGLLTLAFPAQEYNLNEIENKTIKSNSDRRKKGAFDDSNIGKVALSIGRSSHVAPNHIVGAITERTSLSGSSIGKIEIYDDHSIVSIPRELLAEFLDDMAGCKICGKPTTCIECFEENKDFSNKKSSGSGRGRSPRRSGQANKSNRSDYSNKSNRSNSDGNKSFNRSRKPSSKSYSKKSKEV